MEFEIKNAEFQQKTAQEVRIRSDSGNGVDQPQAVTVSVKAEALLYAAVYRDPVSLLGVSGRACPDNLPIFRIVPQWRRFLNRLFGRA